MKNKNKNKNVEAARKSLNEILKQIEPYMPKTPKAEKKSHRTWQIADSNVLPPLNSLGRD